MKGVFLVAGLAVLVVLAGCLGDAPRGNPLDPNSANYRDAGSVAGRAARYYPPHTGLADVQVRLTPAAPTAGGSFLVRTGPDGRFVFADLPTGRYALTAEKPGFAPGVDSVTIVLGRITEAELRLDGLPHIANLALRTVHISRWWPQDEPDVYLLEVVADVEDPDGVADVAGAWLELASASFVDTLQATSVAGRFVETLQAKDLPGGSLHALLGEAFVVRARDHAGFTGTTGPRQLVRVIEPTPVAVSPQGLETVPDARPVFTWEAMKLPYPFTYRLEVVRIVENNVAVVEQSVSGLAATTTTWQAPAPLARGTYYWTLSVVDALGNRSRSKEAGFQVE